MTVIKIPNIKRSLSNTPNRKELEKLSIHELYILVKDKKEVKSILVDFLMTKNKLVNYI